MANSVVVVPLVRTDEGHVVHRADCHYVTRSGQNSKAVPWHWAKGRHLDEVSAAVSMVGSRSCRLCNPTTTADVV